MSSRAASGRKRLRPGPTAPPPQPVLAPPHSRLEIDPSHPSRSPVSQMPFTRSPLTPSPSSSSPSSQSLDSGQWPSRDSTIGRWDPSTDAIPTPNPLPSQFQPYRPLPLKKNAIVPPIRRLPDVHSQSPHPAPSYTALSVHFSDSEGMESRRSSTSRALPPYPSTPPTNTGWAALSDTKAASAMAVPPSYPAQPGEQGHFSPPLPSPFGSQSQIPRPGSVASSTRPETPQSESRPPYSSPSSSPPLLPLRLKVSSPPGPSLPLQRGTVNYSLATSYPTPHSSSVSSPSNSLASLPVELRRLDVHHEANLSGSSESVSGGSNSSIRQELRQTAMPITPSSSALSSSSSSSSSANSQRPGQQPPSQPPSVDSPFVFPSSRSSARPTTGSTPGVTGFKFRGRRKAKTPLATVQVLAPGTPIPSEGIFTAQPQPHSQIRAQISPTATASDAPRQQRAPPAAAQNLRLVRTVSAGSGSSGSGPSSPTSIPPTFYFPSARTRAHPKSSTPIIFNKGKKKDDGQGPRAQGPRFLLGMGLNRRRKAVVTDLRPQAAVPRDRTPSPMERTFLNLMPVDEQHPTPTPEELRTSYEDADSPDRAWARPPPVVTKFNSYPLDAYDSTLIESDRQTWELLRKLNAVNSPSFYNYGGRPPQNVLDLGCGQGHWMLDAAIAWQAAGTQITGFDMVDMTKALWPVAQRQGVLNKIKFVRGNFVKQPLPFADGSFQLVRMASLALCIPYEKWDFVLHQVRRVLAVGGRLEFIDDHVFFPYGKPPLLNPSGPPRSAVAPHLDTMIPNTVFSRMSLADVVNPTIRDDADSEIYNLYGVEEEGETSDTDTVGSNPRRETFTPHGGSSSSSLLGMLLDPEVWHQQAAAARELESLFEHMMNVKFGIHLRPSEFVFEIMMRIFGGAKEVTTMHLTLAPPDQHQALDTRESQGGSHHIAFFGRPASLGSRPPASVPAAPDSDTLGHCPGLILWPSTFIPMPLAELETHASKHLRVLLSCKSALAEYAAEIADQDESENQSEAAMEALWEYENFIRERFNPPPDDPTRGSDTSSASDTNSMHNSVFSVTSVGSDAFDAMREYQTELRTHFEFTPDAAQTLREPTTPTPTPRVSIVGSPPPSTSTALRPRKPRCRGSRGRDRSSSLTSSAVPPYSRIELTHVRTFYVYEAVKLADGRFGGTI